jgi:hypothetical protein
MYRISGSLRIQLPSHLNYYDNLVLNTYIKRDGLMPFKQTSLNDTNKYHINIYYYQINTE